MAKFTLIDEAPAAPAKAKFTLIDDPDPIGTTTQNVLAGAGKAVSDAALGIEQRQPDLERGAPLPLKIPMMAGRVLREKMTGRTADVVQADIDEAKRLDAPLMATTSGKVGNVAGNVGVATAGLLAPGANTYLGSTALGSLLGMIQPTAQGESPALNTVLGGAGGAVGKFVGDKVASGARGVYDWVAKRGAAAEAANTTKDATLATARDAGYVVPPTQANPSAWNHLVEGLAGKARTAQGASVKNQEVTNRLAKEALGLPEDQPITKQALKAVRDQAGKAYDDLAGGTFATDATFKSQVRALSDAQRTLAKEVPELADKEVLNLAQSLDRDQFDGRTLIEVTKKMREKATKAFKDGATDAGRFYKGVSRELEDLIERNLLYTGSGGQNALNAFREARKAIAQSHTIEGALNGDTGNVSAASLAAQLQKGKKLSGELQTAASFASAFPKANQNPGKIGGALALSPLDYFAAMGMAAGDMGITSGLGLIARPAARAALLSKPYQSMMTTPRYGPGAGLRMLAGFAGNDFTRRAMPAAAASGALATQ